MGSRWKTWTLCSVLVGVLLIGVAAAAQNPPDFKTSAQKEAWARSQHPASQTLPTVKVDDAPATLTPEVILYDQNNNPSATLNTTSQNFEAAYDIYDTFAADDFVVTGSGWNVTAVLAPGAYSATHGTPASIHVQFYNDAAGLPGGAPVCDIPAATFVEAPVGTFTINVAPTCTLAPGLKWVMVQVNMNFAGGGGQWFWTTRTVQSNNGCAWQNPGGGFGTPCATWGREATCLANAGLIDHTFNIQGTIATCTVDADCADGNLCNGVETCTAGACAAGTPVNCVDGLFCTQDICTPATGLCSHPLNPCTDGNGCNQDGCDETNDVCTHTAGVAQTFCNTGLVTIRDGAAGGLPYPSTIAVAGLGASASLCSVDLKGLTHTFPDDIDFLLVGPAGGSQNRTIMSDVGGSADLLVPGINLNLRDSAAGNLPDAGPLVAGTFKPTNVGATDAFPAPAPAATGLAPLSPAFEGINPNGNWSLYVVDDSGGDTGTLQQGWCVNIVVNGCAIDADCADGNPCNGNETCVAGSCTPGTPTDCNDNDVCTNDVCNPGNGLCTHPAVVCNDNNVCTDDTCVSPAQGCTFTNNTAPCTDNNPCTNPDVCAGGACVPGAADPCDDANSCTNDSCDAGLGCLHIAAAGGACNDGNACTDADTCQLPCTGSFTENFDGVVAPALPAGWTTAKLAGQAADAVWTTGASTDTAPNGAITDDVPHVVDKVLVTPPLSGASQITFRNNFNLEFNTTTPTIAFDGMVLEIKIGAGAFQDIITAGGSFVTGGYNKTVSTQFASPLANRPAWSGNSGGFITTTVNLPAAAQGQQVSFRWRVACDSSVEITGGGVIIDTVSVTTCASSCTGTAIGSPGEVSGDMFAPNKTTYSWSPTALATQYDVVSGGVAFLPVGPGGGDEVCFPNIVGNSLNDATTPAVGQGFWYLVRGENACAAPGGYGTDSNLNPRLTTTCP